MSPRATVPSSIVLNKGGPEIFSGKYNACTQRQIGMLQGVRGQNDYFNLTLTEINTYVIWI